MRLRASILFVLALAVGACTGPASDGPAASGPLLPAIATKLSTLETIELRTAGDQVAVTLERKPSGWTVRERTGWPADPELVRALLEDLAAAQRVEAKTARPDRYSRIGVESVSAADASGVEVRMRGKGWNESIIVGAVPPTVGGRFVRRSADAQAWQVDKALDVPREPAQWLDTRLLDVPLARVMGVHSRDAAGHAFALAHRDDRFRITDVPSAAMGDSHRGDALASLLTDLRLEDVAADDGAAAAERIVEFMEIHGRVIRFEAWRIDGRVWTRVRQCKLPPPYAYDEVCVQSTPWSGRRVLLSAPVAATLLMTRDQVLGRMP